MGKIHIDLRDLTEAHLQACLPHIRDCRYSAPCIIGTLMDKDDRKRLDGDSIPDGIEFAIKSSMVTIPDDQIEAAIELQEFFDSGRMSELMDLARVWIEAEPPHA